MKEEVKKKKLALSNGALFGILGVLVLLIIGLAVGIAIPKNGKNPQLTENGEDKLQVAQAACETIAQRYTNPDEEFVKAVERFESVSDDSRVDRNPEFENCYVGIASYYQSRGERKKVLYYSEIVSSFASDVEKQRVEEAVRQLEEGTDEDKALLERIRRQYAEEMEANS